MASSFPPFSKEVLGKLELYHDLLISWQKKYNLVGASTLKHVWERHFIDSAQLFSYCQNNKKISLYTI